MVMAESFSDREMYIFFGYNTFEVLSSRLKPGCAEDKIVNGLLDLMDESRR